jgi:hypothetical protein
MNCPVFVAKQAELAAEATATKAAAKAASQRAYRKTRMYKEYRLRWRASPACKWASFKAQARSRRIDITITKGEYMALVVRPCVYCGENKAGLLRGIDRVDSDGKYAAGNVAPCCGACNFMKHKLPLCEFLARVQRISSRFSL